MQATNRILIIRPSALGDVCRTVPVLVSLRRAYPDASIDWLVQDSFVDAIWHHPGLNEAIPFARGELGSGMKRGRLGGLWSLLRKVRGGTEPRYDLVLDCQGLARSGFFAWVTGAHRRIGYADAREMGWLGVNQRIAAPASMHTVDRMLALVNGIGVEPIADMRLYTGPQERAWVERQARLWGAGGGGGYVVIAPTSRWAGKRWSAERFAAVAQALLGGGRVGAVTVVGAASERDQCGPLLVLSAREPRVVDLVGKTTVGQLMALVQGSALVIASDSAALHMAVGFDRPSIGLFGPTRVELVGPYQKHKRGADAVVIQHVADADRIDHKDEASGRELMARVSTDEVAEAAARALDTMRGVARWPV